MKILAVVPARSGSKGVKDKNIYEVDGVPLLGLAVTDGVNASSVSDVLISTDSLIYADIARSFGAKFNGLRKPALSGDSSKTIDVVLEIIDQPCFRDVTHVVLLQPSSPLRGGKLIEDCIKLSLETNESVVTVAKVGDPHPFKLKKIVDGVLLPFIEGASSEVNRQSLPPAYELTGAVYVSSVDNLRSNNSFFSSKTMPIVMDRFINIDTQDDLDYLEYLIKEKKIEFNND